MADERLDQLVNTITLFAFKSVVFLYDSATYVFNTLYNFMSAIINHIVGEDTVWVYIGDSSIPIVKTKQYRTPSNNINWIYDEQNNTLFRSNSYRNTTQLSKLPWLSASVICGDNTYSMDTWLETFRFYTTDDLIPSRDIILSTWSVTSTSWFASNSNAMFHIILQTGDEVDIPIFGEFDNWSTYIFEECDNVSDDETDTSIDTNGDVPEQETAEQQAVEQQAVEQQAVEQQAVEQETAEQETAEQQAVEQGAVETGSETCIAPMPASKDSSDTENDISTFESVPRDEVVTNAQ